MLQLTINYESKWGNSFLDGDNNSPIPKEGRSYVAASKRINSPKEGEASFIRRTITKDTVMGVLNRLIGDQRKLYQARAEDGYYFNDVEKRNLMTFDDVISAENEEMVYLRNFGNSTDKNAFSGMIDASHPAFTSDFSQRLWAVLFLPLPSLCDFVLNDAPVNLQIDCCPVSIADQYNKVIFKMKPIKVKEHLSDELKKVLDVESFLSRKFDVNYRDKSGENIQVQSIYCSALYLQLERLSEHFDVSAALAKRGGLSGFSKRLFTYKDFMKAFTTGEGKITFGNPYVRETIKQGVGKVREMLKKTSGTLTVTLDIDDVRADELITMIRNAGVMSFPLGKKGLAYVEKMKVVS